MPDHDSVHRMQSILNTLKQTVCADRNETHGDPYEQFGMTAALWSIVFNREFTRADVALAMQLSKISRERHGQDNPDDDLDNLGYGLIKAAVKQMDKADAEEAEGIDMSLINPRFKDPLLFRCGHCRSLASSEDKCMWCDGEYKRVSESEEAEIRAEHKQKLREITAHVRKRRQKLYPVFMSCRECNAVREVERITRFTCEACGGRYGKLLGERSTL